MDDQDHRSSSRLLLPSHCASQPEPPARVPGVGILRLRHSSWPWLHIAAALSLNLGTPGGTGGWQEGYFREVQVIRSRIESFQLPGLE